MSDECICDEDNQSNKARSFGFSLDLDHELCLALKSPVKIEFGLCRSKRSNISKIICRVDGD